MLQVWPVYPGGAGIRQICCICLALWLVEAWAGGTALAQATVPYTERALTPITVRLKWRHQFQSAGFYAAVEQGYYREAGLDVSLRVPEPGEDPVEAVQAGKAT